MLGLWAVGLLAILGGKTLLKVLPIKWITRIAAVALVAVDELECPIRPEMFGHRFAKITKAAGLPVIRLHDLRHTAASLMHDSGTVSLRTLAAMLGHADPAFTLRTYAHSSDEAMQTASTALASLFSSGH